MTRLLSGDSPAREGPPPLHGRLFGRHSMLPEAPPKDRADSEETSGVAPSRPRELIPKGRGSWALPVVAAARVGLFYRVV